MHLSDESLEQARDYAKAALERMERLSIRPVPTNFCVWYAYHAGKSPELRHAVDAVIARRQPFTDAVCEELYERFFTLGREQTKLRAGLVRAEETLAELVSDLGEVARSTSRYSASLAEISGGLSADAAAGDVTALVQRLREETAALQGKIELLDNRFAGSSETVRLLRERIEGLRRESLIDPLTGIANRGAFDAALREAARRSVEAGTELSVLLLDIDHFKSFNDTWGHPLGDQVLRLVARTLKDNVKGQDLTSRYGGEEFAVMLPQTALADAVTLANKIRHAFAMRQLVMKESGDTIGALTVSIGVSRYEPGEAPGNLLARADQALSAAKRDGRNRVVAEDALRSLAELAPAN